MDEPAKKKKKAAAVNTNRPFRHWNTIHCPEGSMGWAEEREREKKNLACHEVSVRQRKRLLMSSVNINWNAVVNAYQLHPMLCFWITDWHFIQRQPTEWTHCHPTSSLKQCIMSPVKPLQCRSVTTHLFSQYSLASLSDCSLSSHNPALSHQQRCLTDAMDFFFFFFWLHTYLRGLIVCFCLGLLGPTLT